MKRQTVLLAALVALAPAALLAADPTPPAEGPGPRGDWFKKLDTNQDGVITKDEAQAAANAHVAKSFEIFDTNHDGTITQDEIKAVQEQHRAEMEAKFAERFKQADTNGDGLLSKDEVQAAMPRLAQVFDKLDTNKDGQLSADEIKAGHPGGPGHRMGHGGWKDPPAEH